MDVRHLELLRELRDRGTLAAVAAATHRTPSADPRGAEGLVSTGLVGEPIDVALPSTHPLAARERLHADDLRGSVWVGVPEGYPFDTILAAVENRTGESLERRIRLRDNHLVEALVGSGVGLALLPRYTTRPRPGVVLRP